MNFEIGDIVEPIYCPGVHRMVVELNPGLPYVTPHPSIVVAWKDHGKEREACVEARNLRLVYRAASGAGRSAR